jgi:hypothetical protein
MPNSRVKFITVDGFQPQEADIVYLLTTRSTGEVQSKREGAYFDPLKFIKNSRRTTVALSRGKSGLFVHGNLKTLATGMVWYKFFMAALEKTFVVDPAEFSDNCDKPGFGCLVTGPSGQQHNSSAAVCCRPSTAGHACQRNNSRPKKPRWNVDQ